MHDTRYGLQIKTTSHQNWVPPQTPGHHTLSIGDGGAAGLAKGSAVPRWPGWTGLPSCDHVSHEA